MDKATKKMKPIPVEKVSPTAMLMKEREKWHDRMINLAAHLMAINPYCDEEDDVEEILREMRQDVAQWLRETK